MKIDSRRMKALKYLSNSLSLSNSPPFNIKDIFLNLVVNKNDFLFLFAAAEAGIVLLKLDSARWARRLNIDGQCLIFYSHIANDLKHVSSK